VRAQVEALVGSGSAFAVLGTQGRRLGMIKEFEAVKPFIPVGGYVIMEETVLNGHPVWPAFGLGPAEAVRQILVEHRDFVADITMERYGVSFNPGGFLKRVT
jgi:cephalosporin hydroxylase